MHKLRQASRQATISDQEPLSRDPPEASPIADRNDDNTATARQTTEKAKAGGTPEQTTGSENEQKDTQALVDQTLSHGAQQGGGIQEVVEDPAPEPHLQNQESLDREPNWTIKQRNKEGERNEQVDHRQDEGCNQQQRDKQTAKDREKPVDTAPVSPTDHQDDNDRTIPKGRRPRAPSINLSCPSLTESPSPRRGIDNPSPTTPSISRRLSFASLDTMPSVFEADTDASPLRPRSEDSWGTLSSGTSAFSDEESPLLSTTSNGTNRLPYLFSGAHQLAQSHLQERTNLGNHTNCPSLRCIL